LATDADLPANTLTYSIQSGSVTGMSINSSTGAFSWTPDSSQIGGAHSLTFKVTDSGDPALSDEETITITVEKRSTTLIYTGDVKEQYSDVTSLSALLTDTASGSVLADKPVVFTIIGHVLPSVSTDVTGVASTTYTVTDPAGSYSVTAAFAGDTLYKPSADADPVFTVTKEIVYIKYIGDTFKWVNQDAGDTSDDCTWLNLKAILREDDDGNPGNLKGLDVVFELGNLMGPGSFNYAAETYDSNGNVSLTTDCNIPTGLYEVLVQVGNNAYYTTAIDMRTISVPDWANRTSHVEGSGDINVPVINEDDASAASFGFYVEYGKKSPTGFFTFYYYVDEDGDGTADFLYVIKNNSWAKGGLVFDGEDHAYFESKATVKKFDLTTGENVYTSGNGMFYVEIKDAGEGGTDSIAVTIWDGRSIAFEIGTLAARSTPFDGEDVINDGNITVVA
jgi:hypothetical protein